MTVKSIESGKEFAELISQPKLSVIDFYATWCGPCKVIKPAFLEFSNIYPDVSFGQVDVDQLKEVAQIAQITSMPTFQFYISGRKVDELKGANKTQLENLIKKHASTATTPSSSSSPFIDLTDSIEMGSLDSLNVKINHPFSSIFKNDATFLESDVDEQIIFDIHFKQAVKLHSFKITAPKENGPKTIKTFINRPLMSFDEAQDCPAIEEIFLDDSDITVGKVVPLKYVKYQNVHSIQLFVVDNLGDQETTIIKNLVFMGVPLDGTNVGDIRKAE